MPVARASLVRSSHHGAFILNRVLVHSANSLPQVDDLSSNRQDLQRPYTFDIGRGRRAGVETGIVPVTELRPLH
jgi:hypothetical protein